MIFAANKIIKPRRFAVQQAKAEKVKKNNLRQKAAQVIRILKPDFEGTNP